MVDDSAPQPSAVGTILVPPTSGEVITSLATGISYVMGNKIGEGFFGVVYECTDPWDNELAAKILKPTRTHDELAASAQAEVQKTALLKASSRYLRVRCIRIQR
jgi:serine/threonine protein kinase